jgi:hypothetical protein
MQSLVRVGAEERPRGFDICRAEPCHLMQNLAGEGCEMQQDMHLEILAA